MHPTQNRRLRSLIILALALSIGTLAIAQQQERSAVPDRYKWDLSQIYANDQAWRAAKDKLSAEIPAVRAFKGTLGTSAQKLAEALELTSRLGKEFARLYVYAGMTSDQDTRVSTYQGMQQEMSQIGATFGAETAYIEPEILKTDPATIEGFIAKEPRLKVYNFYLHDILRRREHTLSDAEESLLASSSVATGAPADIYNVLSNADFPYPSVTLSDGKTVKLDSSGFNLYRTLPNRADREKVMSAFFTSVGKFSSTFGATMNAEAQKVLFYAKARRYATALESDIVRPENARRWAAASSRLRGLE